MARKTQEIIVVNENITPKMFAKMIEDHDPTYIWSKNQNHIMIEKAKEKEILKARAILGDKICIPIWNGAMRKKVVPSFVEEYLWSFHEYA